MLKELGRRAQLVVPGFVNRNRVLRTRAMFEPPLLCIAKVEVDEELVDDGRLCSWLDLAARQIGIGGSRPERSGTCRLFMLAPSEQIVTHSASQVKLAPVNDGLHAYLLGSEGNRHASAYVESFSTLAQQHAGVTKLRTGTNPGTGKSVTITYLPAENKIRISTYYPDTQYDVNKPYVFTVDSGHNVVHEQW